MVGEKIKLENLRDPLRVGVSQFFFCKELESEYLGFGDILY